jgi:RNA polymerase sigma factor (sigma-70 family)
MVDTHDQKSGIRRLLQRLQSDEALEAWREFLTTYSRHIYKVIRSCEHEDDDCDDCFVFVCEQLKRREFRRLLQFQPDGLANFSTWLIVVVRNLVRDWQRKKRGRPRPFQSVRRLSVLEQEIYHCVYEEGLGLVETYWLLRPRFPQVTHELVNKTVDLISTTLSARQRWLLRIRRPSFQSVDDLERKGSPQAQVVDSSPSPEERAIRREREEALKKAFAELSQRERVILRLRYEKGLSLKQIARIAKIQSPQMADFRIQKILAHLKKRLG